MSPASLESMEKQGLMEVEALKVNVVMRDARCSMVKFIDFTFDGQSDTNSMLKISFASVRIAANANANVDLLIFMDMNR